MDVITYRKLVVPNATTAAYVEGRYPVYWELETEEVDEYYRYFPKIRPFYVTLNRSLVDDGQSFWTGTRRLALGYNLIENPKIFRSIFCHLHHENKELVLASLIRKLRRLSTLVVFYKKLPMDVIRVLITLAF